jgi:hypothetical protein
MNLLREEMRGTLHTPYSRSNLPNLEDINTEPEVAAALAQEM